MNPLHLADIETAFPDDPAHPCDVILLVKANISSDHYEGAPQVCLPWARLQRLPAFPPATFGHHEIPTHMRGQFLKTAKAIEKPPWNLQRAAVYLRKLLADDSPVSLPDISWVNNADRPHAPAAPTLVRQLRYLMLTGLFCCWLAHLRQSPRRQGTPHTHQWKLVCPYRQLGDGWPTGRRLR